MYLKSLFVTRKTFPISFMRLSRRGSLCWGVEEERLSPNIQMEEKQVSRKKIKICLPIVFQAKFNNKKNRENGKSRRSPDLLWKVTSSVHVSPFTKHCYFKGKKKNALTSFTTYFCKFSTVFSLSDPWKREMQKLSVLLTGHSVQINLKEDKY